MAKPKATSSLAERELDKAQQQFDAFDQNIKDLTMDRMNEAPKADIEPQTKLAQKDIEKSNDIYLKPKKTIGCREKFNEKFRDEYNYQKEYVYFTAENHEAVGETIDIWTRPFPGLPAEEWLVPVNTPLWGPRYLAEQIKRKSYHRLRMDQSVTTGFDEKGNQHFGSMVVDTTVPRLSANPVSKRKSVFMGAQNF